MNRIRTGFTSVEEAISQIRQEPNNFGDFRLGRAGQKSRKAKSFYVVRTERNRKNGRAYYAISTKNEGSHTILRINPQGEITKEYGNWDDNIDR